MFCAFDGPTALKIAQREQLDLILLDVMMPQMDGIEVLTRLKANAATRAIPVFLVTAKHLDEDVIRGLDMGAQHYIKKPFSFGVMAARIRSALHITGGRQVGLPLAEAQHRAGRLTPTPAHRRARRCWCIERTPPLGKFLPRPDEQ